MTFTEYTLLAASSLFVIVDPVATVPAFLAMTHDDTVEQRTHIAGVSSLMVAGVLITFALAGKWIFKFLGITMPAFQIAASIVLLLVALDMLRAQRSRVQETSEETEAGASKSDIAFTPLAVPMLAGPGAISTAILLKAQAADVWQTVSLCGCILTVALSNYLILRVASRGARWLNPIAMRIATRIMGLLLAAIAAQFMVNALKALQIVSFSAP